MHVMHALVPAAADVADSHTVHPVVAAGGLALVRKKHAQSEGLLDTRSASPLVPASIAAVGLEGILSESSSEATNIEKSQCEEHRKIVFLQAK